MRRRNTAWQRVLRIGCDDLQQGVDLTKLNAFDLVVTVALGSTLATILLSKDVVLAEGVLALALLIGLQYAITWLSVRSPRFQRIIKRSRRSSSTTGASWTMRCGGSE